MNMRKALWILSAIWALSCGHAQGHTPPAAQAPAAIASTPEPQPAALQQTTPHEPDKAAASSAGEAPPVATESIESFMLEHFVIATWARDAIVDGNIETIREPLLALAQYSYANVAPGGWMNGVAQLQAAARLTAQAQTLGAAASGVAAMARICGQCHAEHGGLALGRFETEKKAPKTDRLDARMFRHAWAVERMWEGLTAPSDDAWTAGASALAHAPVTAPETQPALPPDVVQTLARVRQLGVKAANTDSADAREKLYGELLVTCADCHRYAPKLAQQSLDPRSPSAH